MVKKMIVNCDDGEEDEDDCEYVEEEEKYEKL
jgi:hypothetical protein